jgi:Icc-related predicted phosphoesterase
MKVAHVSDNHSNMKLVFQIAKSDAELLIWTGDSLPDIGPVGYGHRISWPDEQKYQLSVLNSIGRELEIALQGRPVVFVRGNHDFIPFQPTLRKYGIDFHEISDTCSFVDIMGKRFAGFRQIPAINGMWAGEATDAQLELCVEEALSHNPDILITHSPPYGILDSGYYGQHYGISSLPIHLAYQELKITHHFFGHIHECGGQVEEQMGIKFINGACKFREHQI